MKVVKLVVRVYFLQLLVIVVFSVLYTNVCVYFLFAVWKEGWRGRWVHSDWKKAEGKAGTFKHAAGKWHGDPDDRGSISLRKTL